MNYFHASVVVMCYIFIHTYSVNVLIYYLPKPEEIQHRGFKRKEIRRRMFIPKLLHQHPQNLRSRDQVDKCICLANHFFFNHYSDA